MPSPNRFISILFFVAVALCLTQHSLGQYSISTIAGGGPNNLVALSASIGYPESIAFDSGGNAYIAESYANQILEVSTAGTVTVVAGNGTTGYSGDGGPATSAALYQPEGVFVDASGNIFIADTENSVIREVSASTRNIQTIVGTNYDAGGGSACSYGGDGGPALNAHLCLPYSVFVDGSGSIFIADFGNSVIREVVASSNNIETIAGTGTPGFVDGVLATRAELDLPAGVSLDASGNIFIADTFNSVVRVINPGTQPVTVAGTVIAPGFIQTVAGSQYDSLDGSSCQLTGDGGPALSAFLCLPFGVAVDGSDGIFIADYGNFAIREVPASGNISTVAGTLGTVCQTYLTGNTPGCGNGGPATSASLNYPSAVSVDSSGDLFIADTQDFVVREVTAANGDIQAFAGNGTEAYSGDGGSATNAELNDPGTVFLDGSGDIFIADTSNSVIREVVANTSDIQTVAGNGVECAEPTASCGDGSTAAGAQLNNPQSVALDASGNIYIADTVDNRIRVVNPSTQPVVIAGIPIPPGAIATVAGNGTACTPSVTPGCGDSGPATSAELSNPNGVFVDSAGNIFIADTSNNVIREVAATGAAAGTITTVAGNYVECTTPPCGDGGAPTSAQLNNPVGVFVDLSENIFIADTFDYAIREVSSSTSLIQTVAGVLGTAGYSGDGGAATSALLNSPYGVFVDNSRDIYIADSENDAIREVVAASGDIQTIAGIAGNFATPGFSGDGGPATSAELNFPSGIYGNSDGKLFFADTNNSRTRELAPAAISVTVSPGTATVVVSALQQFTATVTGNPNTGVNWFVNGVTGGNSTVGTITTSGLFQAPAAVPSPAAVTISAVSQVDNTTTGLATATISGLSQTVTVSVSSNPSGITQVYTGAVQPFIATVTGTSNTAVNWYAEGSQGGDATYGSIDASGNYTAPASVPPTPQGTVVIEAVSQADSTGVGTDSIMVILAPVAQSTTPQTVNPGGTAVYTISLTRGTNITLTCLQSSLPSGASCSFSPTAISVGTNSTMTVSVPSSSAALSKGNSARPQLFFAFVLAPLAGLLFVGGKQKRRARWSAMAVLGIFLLSLVACGGGGSSPGSNPVTYNIKVQGAAGQLTPVTITIASLTVN